MWTVEVWIQGMYVRTFTGFQRDNIEIAMVMRGYWPDDDGVAIWSKE